MYDIIFTASGELLAQTCMHVLLLAEAHIYILLLGVEYQRCCTYLHKYDTYKQLQLQQDHIYYIQVSYWRYTYKYSSSMTAKRHTGTALQQQ